MSETLLDVSDLNIEFHDHDRPETVVHDFDLMLGAGEIVGIVGESGSGKSMSAMAIAGLLPRHAARSQGKILYQGLDLLTCSREELRRIQGSDISIIFQEPMSALDPLKKIGWQVGESILLHHPEITAGERRKLALQSMRNAGLPDPEKLSQMYPYELSGGMRQRVCIAAAMISNPKILIADEPTTALDVLVQAQIIDLLKRINRDRGTSILFISHDLSLVAQLCSRVLVMHHGRVVETGRTEEIFSNPQKDYTRKLIGSIPRVDLSSPRRGQLPCESSSAAVNGMSEEPGAGKENVTHGGGEHSPDRSTVLEVRDLNVFYRESGTAFYGRRKKQVLHGISLVLHRGEFIALVGESGCGKTTLARAVTGLNPNYTGRIHLSSPRPQMVFQDPAGSLNPSKTIGWILEEPLRLGGRHMSATERRQRVQEMCRMIQIDEALLVRYPSQLSGGQKQRVSIACALMQEPEILVADEPVSALDVTVQAEILALLRQLRERLHLSVLFISHDLRTVFQLCDNVVIMKEGRIIEQGSVDRVYRDPQETYTKELLAAAGIHQDSER